MGLVMHYSSGVIEVSYGYRTENSKKLNLFHLLELRIRALIMEKPAR